MTSEQLRAARDAAQARRDAADAAMLAADTGSEVDWPAFDRAAKAFDQADAELAEIADLLDEIEEADAFAEARERRADYRAAVLR